MMMKYFERRLLEPSTYAGIAALAAAWAGPKYGDAVAQIVASLFAIAAMAMSERGQADGDGI